MPFQLVADPGLSLRAQTFAATKYRCRPAGDPCTFFCAEPPPSLQARRSTYNIAVPNSTRRDLVQFARPTYFCTEVTDHQQILLSVLEISCQALSGSATALPDPIALKTILDPPSSIFPRRVIKPCPTVVALWCVCEGESRAHHQLPPVFDATLQRAPTSLLLV